MSYPTPIADEFPLLAAMAHELDELDDAQWADVDCRTLRNPRTF